MPGNLSNLASALENTILQSKQLAEAIDPNQKSQNHETPAPVIPEPVVAVQHAIKPAQVTVSPRVPSTPVQQVQQESKKDMGEMQNMVDALDKALLPLQQLAPAQLSDLGDEVTK